jgi:hypothetical protein
MAGETNTTVRKEPDPATRAAVRTAIVVVCVVVELMGWYVVATGYDYGDLAGKYTFRSGNETCTLHLYPDRTFLENMTTHGDMRIARGTWRRIGEGGVVLSDSFLKVSGQQLSPSGETYGNFYRVVGIFPVLALDADHAGLPEFHRSLTSFISKK